MISWVLTVVLLMGGMNHCLHSVRIAQQLVIACLPYIM